MPSADLVRAQCGDPGPVALTERARAECARRVGQDATDVSPIAVDLGVGWGRVMGAVTEYSQRILDGQWLHQNVSVLGQDETASSRRPRLPLPNS